MRRRDRRTLARVVVPYLGFSVAWILLSDHVVRLLAPEPDLVSSLQSIKGLFFVTVSAGLIFLLLRRELQALAEERRTRHEAEARRARAERDLAVSDAEHRVRTEALTTENQQLEEARKRAESADRMKSVFLATMSHELRTPLNSIIGFSGILLQGIPGPLNDEQRKQLGMVQSSARHLLALITDVLDISKIEAGQLEVECKPFDLPDAIRNVVASVDTLAQHKGLRLTVTVHDEVGVVHSDNRRFQQVLLNLLGNAIKFTDTGGVDLLVRPDGPDDILAIVSDTGIGIPEEHLENIFLPFTQVADGTNKKYEGTGLGLSISHRLVERMGGRMWVTSDVGSGSTFCFTVPVSGPRRGS